MRAVNFIATHAYALRAQAKFIASAANSHSHSRIPDTLHSPEIYETRKENYPPEEFVSWTLPAVHQNNSTIISSPVPAKNSTVSAGFKIRRFQPYATAKAKRVKSSPRSPTLAPPRHRQRSSRPSALVEFVGQEHKQTKTSTAVHPGPRKYIAGCPDCNCVADYVVAPTNKKVKIVEPKLLYAKLQKYSFCRWIARYLSYTVLNSEYWEAGSIAMSALSALAVHLERIAFDLNPSLPIFFLTLFYVSSLFPRGIIGRDLYRRESLIVKTLARMFMVGFMLATKWLDDCAFHAKTLRRYFDASCSSFPLRSVNAVEMAALVAFDFDIGLSTQTWIHWLHQLRLVASEVGEMGLCEAPTIYIDGLLLDAKVIEKGGSFKSTKGRVSIPAPLLLDVYDVLVSDMKKSCRVTWQD